jgi:hypothetical protein
MAAPDDSEPNKSPQILYEKQNLWYPSSLAKLRSAFFHLDARQEEKAEKLDLRRSAHNRTRE